MRSKVIAALAALTAAASAQAVIVTTGSGFSYEFLDFSGPGSGVLTPSNPCSQTGADYHCSQMSFEGGQGGDLTVTATRGADAGVVYQDRPDYDRGLGVVSALKPTKDTWISGDEVLKLSFENSVNLVGYHIYQKGNAPGTDHFLVSTDEGATWTARSFASVVYTSNASGNWFTDSDSFWFKAEDKEKFYVGAVKITSAVPEPETYALMLAGLGAVAFAARRRRTKS